MKAARLVVLGVALAAGGGAAYLMSGQKQPEPQRVVVQPPPPPPQPKEAVLVAAHDLTEGSVVSGPDVRWQRWDGVVPPGYFQQSRQPQAPNTILGETVRRSIPAGKPITAEGLRDTSSLMSAALPAGTRAVAIDLADQGRSYAGGFIKPDERVDVIRTFHPDDAPPTVFSSETILTNVRVLAIGPTLQEKPGERTIFGSTATLELTSDQAEKIVLAQRTGGTLTLALRSMSDVATHDPTAEEPRMMTIIRAGNASQTRVR